MGIVHRQKLLGAMGLMCGLFLFGMSAASPARADDDIPVLNTGGTMTMNLGARLAGNMHDGLMQKTFGDGGMYCRYADNNNGDSYFIPAKQRVEMDAVLAHPPQGVVFDTCLLSDPYTFGGVPSTSCGSFDAASAALVAAHNPGGCLAPGNMTSITFSGGLARDDAPGGSARRINYLSSIAPQPTGVTSRSAVNVSGNTATVTYYFPMVRLDCNDIGDCNTRTWTQAITFTYALSPTQTGGEGGYKVQYLGAQPSDASPAFAAPPRPVWVALGDWSGCSQSCGGGTQSQTVICQNNVGVRYPDSDCQGAPPPSTQSCNTQQCPDVIAEPVVPDGQTQPPTPQCFFQVSGVFIDANSSTEPSYSGIGHSDTFSNLVGAGDYPLASTFMSYSGAGDVHYCGGVFFDTSCYDGELAQHPFMRAAASTFDGIALGPHTHVTIYSQPNFQGSVYYDGHGPLVMNNNMFTGDTAFQTDVFPEPYQTLLPPSVRTFSSSNMQPWGNGTSVKVRCD